MIKKIYIFIFSILSLSVFGETAGKDIQINPPTIKPQRINSIYSPSDIAANDPRVTVYPNPTSESFTVKIELDKNAEVEIFIYNAIGKLIFTYREIAPPGTYYKLISNFEEQPTGLYFVHVKAGEIKSIERLIKVK